MIDDSNTFKLTRWVLAFIDPTLLCFGIWWLYTVSFAWVPTNIIFILLTVIWLVEFIGRIPTLYVKNDR